ncbi:hypothetical protein M9458_050322, partial [Cirrhinus mrigala]
RINAPAGSGGCERDDAGPTAERGDEDPDTHTYLRLLQTIHENDVLHLLLRREDLSLDDLFVYR